eukprot:2044678-Lingulodinium_polyedra.AAC.1
MGSPGGFGMIRSGCVGILFGSDGAVGSLLVDAPSWPTLAPRPPMPPQGFRAQPPRPCPAG